MLLFADTQEKSTKSINFFVFGLGVNKEEAVFNV